MNNDSFCDGLLTQPQPSIGKVLVTGGTGYVGGRLVPELLARGYRVRVLVRAATAAEHERWPEADVVEGDVSDEAAVTRALSGVHTAYYLVHSLLLGPRQFELQDRINATVFGAAAERCGLKRIIYLGGLGDVRTLLSAHLRSRTEVAETLQRGRVPTTVLRAAIIIGSGSASYEILHRLVTRLPIILLPHWMRTQCQPIAIRDVIRYLVGVLETPETAGESFDIGGPDLMTYGVMMRTLASILGKRRLFVDAVLGSVRFYAYFAGLLTPVPAPIVRSLMEGLRNDVICLDNRILAILPFSPLSYREAILEAMSREEHDAVHTRWSDAYPLAHELAIKLHELRKPPRYVRTYTILTEKPAAALFRSISRVGGREGWFHGNWMWRMRGMLDSLLMGVGSGRGRRSASSLRVNDVIDFWRVETLIPNRRLLLRAEMKLPGRAWLEFTIDPSERGHRLGVTAYFDTQSLWGRLYWHFFFPFHGHLFGNLIRLIASRS